MPGETLGERPTKTTAAGRRVARAIEVRGVVQGVGFRPFVWWLANELGLDGTVVNRAGQVRIEIVGPAEGVDAFMARMLAPGRRAAPGTQWRRRIGIWRVWPAAWRRRK